MRLQITGEDIYFDEFPKHSKANQKVFLSHLFNVNALRLSHLDIIPDIYTSAALGAQLRALHHCNSKLDISKLRPNLHQIPLHTPTFFELTDGTKLKIVLLGNDNNYSPHLMFILQKGNDLPHLYVGISSLVRETLLKTVVAESFLHGIGDVYVDLRRATEVHDARALSKILNKIEDILDTYCQDSLKIQLIVPIFGYEALIFNLCKKLHTVSIDGVLRKVNIKNGISRAKSAESAKIHIKSRDITLADVKGAYESKKYITVKIVDKAPTTNGVNEYGYCELFWSPLPNPVEIKKIMEIVQPKNIVPVVHKNMVPPQVPTYLLSMCLPSQVVYEQPKGYSCAMASNRVVNAFAMQKDNLRYLDEEETDDSQEFLY